MSPLRVDTLIIAVAAAGTVIVGVYLFMLAVPRNDDEHLHRGISEPGHMRPGSSGRSRDCAGGFPGSVPHASSSKSAEHPTP